MKKACHIHIYKSTDHKPQIDELLIIIFGWPKSTFERNCIFFRLPRHKNQMQIISGCGRRTWAHVNVIYINELGEMFGKSMHK